MQCRDEADACAPRGTCHARGGYVWIVCLGVMALWKPRLSATIAPGIGSAGCAIGRPSIDCGSMPQAQFEYPLLESQPLEAGTNECLSLMVALKLEAAYLAFASGWPGYPYRVQLVRSMEVGVHASVHIPSNGAVPLITLSASRSPVDLAGDYVHELAHLVAGREAGHDETFETAMAELHGYIAAQAFGRILNSPATDSPPQTPP